MTQSCLQENKLIKYGIGKNNLGSTMMQELLKINLHDDNRLLTLWGLKNVENDDEVFVLCSLRELAIKKVVGKNQLAVSLKKWHEYKS